MNEIDRILKTIPSTEIPIGIIAGKTYHYMCKDDISKAIENHLLGLDLCNHCEKEIKKGLKDGQN